MRKLNVFQYWFLKNIPVFDCKKIVSPPTRTQKIAKNRSTLGSSNLAQILDYFLILKI